MPGSSELSTAAARTKASLTVAEFCDRFSVGRTLVYAEIAAGRLLTRKCGRKTLIRVTDAAAWLDALPSGRAS